MAKEYAEQLQNILDDCEGNQDCISRKAGSMYARISAVKHDSLLGDVLKTVAQVYPHKREEYLKGMVSSWSKHHDNYNNRVREWTHQIGVARESTYISCWNSTSSMSLAMWNIYDGGMESVAIRTDIQKLTGLLLNNKDLLSRSGLDGEVSNVVYVEGLKEPDNALQGKLVERLNTGKDVTVGTFSVKPSKYAYENEVRIIVYPTRDLFEPVVDPHPELDGISLGIGRDSDGAAESLGEFIEAVYLHPMLGEESMMVRVVKELNDKYGLSELPIVTDKIEAIGPSVALESTGHVGG